MSIRTQLKKITIFRNMYHWLYDAKFSVATVVSPTLNTKMRYKSLTKVNPDLDNPKTLSEKICWLKLNEYMYNPLVIQCADKYRVREYVKQCGCEDILIDLIDVYDRPEDISWDKLPEKFALKWNFGCGMNIICQNKAQLDISATTQKLRKWGKSKYWLPYSEMHYKYAPKKIICEKLLTSEQTCGSTKSITDYKVYCFHGQPQAILVMHDRSERITAEFFDVQWNALEKTAKYEEPKTPTEQPACLKKMLDAAHALSHPFPFVRCDFYIADGALYFGELTFTPAGGMPTISQTKVNGKDMADLLYLATQKV